MIPTLAERIQDNFSWLTVAHAADWSTVNTKGDLLYVGSTTNFRNRLNPHNHIMWSIYAHEAKYDANVRIAVWERLRSKTLLKAEGWLTHTCLPLWSRCVDDGPWAWRQPDQVVVPEEAARVVNGGVYAWLYLPKDVDLKRVMFDEAPARADRRPVLPRRYYCAGKLGVHPCLYVWIVPPTDKTCCPRCGGLYSAVRDAAAAQMEAALGDIYGKAQS